DGRGDDGLFVLVVADRHSDTLCCATRPKRDGLRLACRLRLGAQARNESRVSDCFGSATARRLAPTRKNAPEVGSGAFQYQGFLGRSVRETAEKGRDLQVVILGLAHLRILLLRLHRLRLTQLLGRAVRRRRGRIGLLLLRLLTLAAEQAPAAATMIALVVEGLLGGLFMTGGRTLGRLLRRRLLTLRGAVEIEVALLRRRRRLGAAGALLIFLDPRIDDRLQVARRVVDDRFGLGLDLRLGRAGGRGFIGRGRRRLRRGFTHRIDADFRLTRRSGRQTARATAEGLALRLDLLDD